MYTWGYLKRKYPSKLNLGETEANQQGFLSNFPYYANEAMTQICSAVKPNKKYLEIVITDDNKNNEIVFPDDFVSF